jgi:ssDNA-binding Zn-finger/Zn-ribbon topoisomerase 1
MKKQTGFKSVFNWLVFATNILVVCVFCSFIGLTYFKRFIHIEQTDKKIEQRTNRKGTVHAVVLTLIEYDIQNGALYRHELRRAGNWVEFSPERFKKLGEEDKKAVCTPNDYWMMGTAVQYPYYYGPVPPSTPVLETRHYRFLGFEYMNQTSVVLGNTQTPAKKTLVQESWTFNLFAIAGPWLLVTMLYAMRMWRKVREIRRIQAFRCGICDYDLNQLPTATTCPECGQRITPQ